MKPIKTSLAEHEYKEFQKLFKKSGLLSYSEFLRFIIFEYMKVNKK